MRWGRADRSNSVGTPESFRSECQFHVLRASPLYFNLRRRHDDHGVVVHVTDEGMPTGHPLAPVVKVSGNEAACEALPDDPDVGATAATAADLQERVGDVLRGGQSRAEAHGVTDFAITRVGPSI